MRRLVRKFIRHKVVPGISLGISGFGIRDHCPETTSETLSIHVFLAYPSETFIRGAQAREFLGNASLCKAKKRSDSPLATLLPPQRLALPRISRACAPWITCFISLYFFITLFPPFIIVSVCISVSVGCAEGTKALFESCIRSDTRANHPFWEEY